jgi:hypothetical protein
VDKKQVTLAVAFICVVSIITTIQSDAVVQQNQQFVAIEGFVSHVDAREKLNLVKSFFQKDKKTIESYGYANMEVLVSVRSSSFTFPSDVSVAMLHIDELLS